jgi:membrane protease subunit (stomatin/prohibitin family)
MNMAVIDLLRWSPQGDKTVYAYRFPETNLSTYTQLIVQESQEAFLFSKGQIVCKFAPGKYTLNTENVPLLRNLFGIPFGGKNPFTAEVWFVNKIQSYSIDWSVSRMPVHDPDYNTQLPLVAGGRYGLKVTDSEKFLIKAVGTKERFTQDDLTGQFYGEFATKTKSQIAQYIIKHRIGFKTISGYLDQLSDYLKQLLNPFWDNLGLELLQFSITSIDIDRSTEDGERIANAIAQQSAMSITGHTWQQEQMFGVAGSAVEGMSKGNGGLLGGLMAMNMMGGMAGGGVGAGMMNPQFNQPSFGRTGTNAHGGPEPQAAPPQERMVFCSNCAKKFPNTHRFCPHCGDPYNPCPRCGTANDSQAKRCISCGIPLQAESAVCPGCNSPVAPGALFCGHCGKQLRTDDDNCSRCGTQLPPNVKFCPACGNRR